MPQLANAETVFDVRDIPTPLIYSHYAVLVNDRTREEVSFIVETLSDRFSDVWLEIQIQKEKRGMKGFHLFEALPLDNPAPF